MNYVVCELYLNTAIKNKINCVLQQQTATNAEMSIFFKNREDPKKVLPGGFPGVTVVGSPPANAGDTCSSPGLGGSHMLRSN